MADVLLVMVLLAAIAVGAVVGVFLVMLHRIVVSNRVVAHRRSTAPLSWLLLPTPEARLHRRLRAVMVVAASAAARQSAGDDLGLTAIVRELEDRAVELDVQLVVTAHAPRQSRRRMLHELRSEVAEVERLVERVVRMSRAWAGTVPSERGLAAVRERLEVLESALRELDGVEVAPAAALAPPRPPQPARARRRLQA